MALSLLDQSAQKIALPPDNVSEFTTIPPVVDPAAFSLARFH
jgi:hypothetical protein